MGATSDYQQQRHSRESANPFFGGDGKERLVPKGAAARAIPAFAGMTSARSGFVAVS
jgi:hypothetical protein